MEGATGVAVCDSDPLKLHYSWSLAAVGATPVTRFEHEFAVVRQMFAQCRLGFADVVLLSIPDPQQLVMQRNGDRTRRAGYFDLHARLSDSLAEWYSVLDRLDRGRVVDGYPSELDIASLATPRPDRHDIELLESLVAELPAL